MQTKRLPGYAGAAIVCAALGILLWLYFLSVGILNDGVDKSFASVVDLEAPSFAGGWIYEESGLEVETVAGKRAHMKLWVSDSCAQITKTVTKDAEPGEMLGFRAGVSSVFVFCNDSLVYTYTDSVENVNFGMPYAMRFFTVALPHLAAGDRITVRFEAADDGVYPIQYMSLGSAGEIYAHILSQQMDTAIICGILAVFAAFQIALSVTHLLMRIRPVRRVHIWLALTVLLAAVWIGTDSGLFLLFIQNGILYYTLQCVSFMLLPGVAMMFIHNCGSHTSRFAPFFSAVDVVAAVFSYLLYFWGKIELSAAVPFFCLLVAVVLGYMLVKLIFGGMERNAFYFSGMLILFIFCAVSLIVYCSRTLFPVSYLFQYGMLAFVLCMAVYIMMDIGRLLVLEQKTAVVESQKSLLESELFLTQISSHFFYNTMNMIRGLIKMDTDAAYRLTDDFVKYIRSHVEAVNAKGGIVPFPKELEAVEAYARISSVRMNGALHVEYDIETVDFEVPALTLEPLVENAIRHGVFPKGEGNITIKVREKNGSFFVTVMDDGVGFEELHEGVGITNIRQRLRRYAGCRLSFESRPGVGTTAKIVYSKNIKEDTKNEDDVGGRQLN